MQQSYGRNQIRYTRSSGGRERNCAIPIHHICLLRLRIQYLCHLIILILPYITYIPTHISISEYIHTHLHSYSTPNPNRAYTKMSTSLEAKIVVLGAQGVGKTSLLMRYIKNQFDPKTTTSTVGASFLTKRVVDAESDTVVRLQIWDTAGQERFRYVFLLGFVSFLRV